MAWRLTAGVLALVIVNLITNVAINRWSKYFFDGLERKDVRTVLYGIVLIAVLAFLSAAIAVVLVHFRMRLQLRWRQWLTKELIRRWLTERRFYQLNVVSGDEANPEYRIADDTRLAIEPLVDFVIGFANAVLAAVTFIAILWTVGGAITVGGITIPGYLVFGAILYAGATSAGMFIVARPLVRKVERKNATEAQLRYELTRVRENAESIALIGGDEDEKVRLDETFAELAARWVRAIVQQGRMTWISNASTVLAPAVPLLLGAPKYLAGELTLGSLMQAAAAFTQVQIALGWLMDNAIRLAEWFASAQRVVELSAALDELDATIGRHGADETINLGHSSDDAVHLRRLSIANPDGRQVIEGADAIIRPGEKVLVQGASGTGKSTLIRAMAGLWPWGSGDILRPPHAKIAFMPQRPYMPLGTLRHAVLYPDSERGIPTEAIAAAVRRSGLSHLVNRLEDEEPWGNVLSKGEQQRVAFARVLLNPPDIIIMDEATSALDELGQTKLQELLRTELPDATVIQVAHRPGLEEYHDRIIHLISDPKMGAILAPKQPATGRGRWWKLRRTGIRSAA